MTNLEIIKSTYGRKSSEENGKNLAKYVADDIAWTEAQGFPHEGTYIGLEDVTKNVFSRLGRAYTNLQIKYSIKSIGTARSLYSRSKNR